MNENSSKTRLEDMHINIKYTLNDMAYEGKMKIKYEDNLENCFKKYKKSRKINNPEIKQKEPAFYIKRRNEKILLNKNEKIENLDINNKDLVFIFFQDKDNEKNESNNEIHSNNSCTIYKERKTNNTSNLNPYILNINKKQKKYILIFSLLVMIFVIGCLALIYYFFVYKKKKKKIPVKKNYNTEELITEKRPYYPKNMLFLYKSDKSMKIVVESDAIKENDENAITKIKEYMDFCLIIREEHQEIYEEQNFTKKWYSGYISLLNLTINNETQYITLNYNEELHKLITKNNKKRKKENLRIIEEISDSDSKIVNNIYELCFIKIEFYENGEPKNIFIPKEFNMDNMVYIKKIINFIIPKLSKNLYSENITQKIDLIDKLSKENNSTNFDEEEEEMDSTHSFLDSDDLNYDSDISSDIGYSDEGKENILRRNSENNTIYDYSENEQEIIKGNSSNNTYTPKYTLKGIDENRSFTNITDFVIEPLESPQAELEGSTLRKIKNSFIDKKGMLVLINEFENISIIQPNKESLSDLTEEEDKLKSEIYNGNNEFEREDKEDFMGKNVSFNISSIRAENANNISLYNSIDDEEFARNIFRFFDNFSYILYNETGNEELKVRVLNDFKNDFIKNNKNISQDEIEFEHTKLSTKKNNIRNLQSYDSYYGMKNSEKEKILFKYNLIGLILEGIVVSKITVSTGKIDNYLKLTLGFINTKIKFNTMQTNLYIIIKNSHQMTFNYMYLLYKSNEELKIRNKIYSNIIIDYEKNVSKLLEDYYDYSDLFRDSLEYLYNQVKNFSGEFFNELIELIENVYDNYTIILNKTENNEFDVLNEIRIVTKNEYMNYINNMFELIIQFKNDTLIFLSRIKQEVDIIQTFQIDILYDIVDVIYDGIIIFREFIKKLFKAVEKGVTIFKYDIRDYMDEIIGELLYLTDFLSININKNEILKNAISLEKRQNVTMKLKNFRNIILRIIEILNNNIIKDYEEEMSLDNENSIRYSKEYIINKCIEDIDEKCNNIIEEIKIKIQFMNYYETYANHVQIINNIMNKSFIEFNDDIYNYALNNMKNISPEYLDKNSDLIANTKYLFSLSHNIVNDINQEIADINKQINLYYTNYMLENNYNYDFNLYNFNKYFTNEFLISLMNEFRSIIKEALTIHYINIINKNYDLAFEYMEEVLEKFKKAPSYRIIGTSFINFYTEYKAIFQEMAYFTSSEEFLKYIEDNYYNVSNYVFNYINEKILSINKYYFNETKNNNYNFYKLDLIQEEIIKISNNLKNHFNEMTLETDIKQTILNISLNEIPSLNKLKEKKFDDLYDSIYNLAENTKVCASNCEIIQLIIRKKRKWYTLWISYKLRYYYYCGQKINSKNNKNEIVKDFSITKIYLDEKFSNLINNYINKFDNYLNNCINYTKIFYDNLFNFTEEKIYDNENIENLLDKYKNIYNNILLNNSIEKIIGKIFENNNINETNINNIIMKLENNLFKLNEEYYEKYYLKENQYFLEYPDELILTLNESKKHLNSNREIVKNKINLYFNERLRNIISSTQLFINNINDFNFQYIIYKINDKNIFEKYILHIYEILNTSFNFSKINNYLNNNEKENYNFNGSYLNDNNYGFFIDNISSNYSDFITNLNTIIDENFTKYDCFEFLNTESNYENDRDINISDSGNINNKNCIKEKYSTDLNYSKYNFNVIKLRTQISNSRKFPEMFNQIFDDLNYNNIIDSDQINEIDNLINKKNILRIYKETTFKSQEIKNHFFILTEETFNDFCNDFVGKITSLTSEFWPVLDMYKNILNFRNISYNNNISKLNENLINNTDILLDEFNKTLFRSVGNLMMNINKYQYYSIDFSPIFNNYFLKIEDSFNNYLSKINNLKNNNLFYSIPKIVSEEIFYEKRKKIEEIIKIYSEKFDFNSIGFKYEINKYLDLFLTNYYISYELNNSYKYFEFIENNSNIYTEKILNNISTIKNTSITKFNLIYNQFINTMKKGENYVQKTFIENLKINNSRCLNLFSDLYLNISDYLNNTNIIESDDYKINNCSIENIINYLVTNLDSNDYICLTIAEINYTLYSNDINILVNCRENNNYNNTYLILESFEDEEKIYLDNIVSNISQTIIQNTISEIFLKNFTDENHIKNTSIEINIDEFHTYFEDIQDLNYYINNLREPEYKNLMNKILIDSFNISYGLENSLKFYLTNEIENKINILVNNKLDFFINYFNNKLKNEFDYYEFLLSKTEELGQSSKLSIINLFTNIPKKLNESIYYLIEDDIFYYIDIFFRENKNIFINNFLNFYLKDVNKYNLNIYKIEDYIIEMISDRNFNKSLNNISSYLIADIKNEIKNKVRKSIFQTLNEFIESCRAIANRIQIKLNQISTNELPEEMETLVGLINNYTVLVENQNSRYNFIVGEEPFNILNIFIHNELEPPLLLILKKYNSIEEELLNRIQTLTEYFPDCYSEIKNNLLGTKIDSIEEYTYLIESTMEDYQNDLVNDINSYLNKLIHYTYIDGLNTVETSCENSDCGIPINSLRKLNEKEITDIKNIYKGRHLLANRSKIENKINKKINYREKRKLSSLPDYTSNMGALTENDIIYYLSDLQNTTLKLNKSYFGKEYLNINLTTNKFLTKINYTFLEKLRFSFDVKLVKFSTILTDKSLQKLKDIILKQFYLIENYVHESSDLVQLKIINFINEINKTSEFIESLSGYIHNKALGYYKLLYSTIQKKYDSSKEKIVGKSVYTNISSTNRTKIAFLEIVSFFNAEINFNFNLTHILRKCLNFSKFANLMDKIDKYTKYEKNFKKTYSIPFPAFQYLQIRFSIGAYVGIGLFVGIDYDYNEAELSLILDVYGEASVPLQLEGGLYLPDSKSPILIALVVGLEGVIGHGRAGIKLEITINNGKTDLDAYFIFNALSFDFYFRLRIQIDLPIYKFNYNMDIIKIKIFGIQIEVHSLKKKQSEAFKNKNAFTSSFRTGFDVLSPGELDTNFDKK